MNQAALEAMLRASLNDLYNNDTGLIERDAHERTLTGRLAKYMEDRIEDYDVTIEYNRHGIDPKEVELPNAYGVLTMKRVMPDIIVHHLGDDSDNLLVIEAKKTSNTATDHQDIAKLSALKHNIGYRFAVFLRLPVGEGVDLNMIEMQWID
jgi:hypothetical protein